MFYRQKLSFPQVPEVIDWLLYYGHDDRHFL